MSRAASRAAGRPAREPALVTGASSGLGEAIAVELARRGHPVTLAARRVERLEAVARAIEAAGGSARVLPMDVSDPDATAAAIRRLDDEVGGLGLIVANAGAGGQRWSGELTHEEARRLVDVNVGGALATLTAVLPRMVERGRGHLVGVTSMAGQRAMPHNAAYGASKAFLTALLDGLRLDLEGTGVRVTEARPGYVDTAMARAVQGPKPFQVRADDAAARVVDGVGRGARLVAFPLPMRALIGALCAMPDPVFSRAARAVRPRPAPPGSTGGRESMHHDPPSSGD